MPDPIVAALLRERQGYVIRGLPHRVALVDAALAARGYKPPKAAVVEEAVDTAQVETAVVRGRRSR